MRKLALVVAMLLCCMASAGVTLGQTLPFVTSYPSADSGWTFAGQVSPVSCFGSCAYHVANNNGQSTGSAFDHTVGSVWEPRNDEIMYVQSNGQNSYANLLFSAPSTQNYVVAVAVEGVQTLGYQTQNSVWPVMQIVLNGVAQPICKYPNGVSITSTQYLTVNANGTYGANIHEYAATCAINIFAGNNNIAVQIVGGYNHGGGLTVRHLLIYPAVGVKGVAACIVGGTWYHNVLTYSDLESLNTAGRAWATATCGASAIAWDNLRNGVVNSTGCTSTGGCAMLQLE